MKEEKMLQNETINLTLARFLDDLTDMLSENLIEIIIHGSYVLDDFRNNSSDLDFVVITRNNLDKDAVSALFDLHDRYRSENPFLLHLLEGTYYPEFFLEELQGSFTGCYIGTGRKGWRVIETLQNSYMDLRLINRSGIGLLGSSPAIYDPSKSEIMKEQISDLNAFRNAADPISDTDDAMWISLVNWCARTILYREKETVASKTESCRWCIQQPHLREFRELLNYSVRLRSRNMNSIFPDCFKGPSLALLEFVDDILKEIQ